jgi:hypothetical protein
MLHDIIIAISKTKKQKQKLSNFTEPMNFFSKRKFKKKKSFRVLRVLCDMRTYHSTQGVEAERDLRNVATFVQIRRLKYFLLWNAVLFQRRLKPAKHQHMYSSIRVCYNNNDIQGGWMG